MQVALELGQRPRVGEMVVLRDGRKGEVAAVRRASQVLQLLREDEAMVFGLSCKSTYGKNWQSYYYQADVIVRGEIVTAEPYTIESVCRPS